MLTNIGAYVKYALYVAYQSYTFEEEFFLWL